jgi:para-aminobenzoate synthetase component 1
MDMNIAIRTIVASKTVMHCWGGGGIVADSMANNEFTESLDKIKLLLNTLEDSIEPTPPKL